MIDVIEVRRPGDKAGKAFINFPHQLYAGSSCWVPPFKRGMRKIITRRHPFFDHSEGGFFTAFDGRKAAGRIAVFENELYNEKHNTRAANFYFFDCVENSLVAGALFGTIEKWAKDRGLSQVIGPMFSAASGGNGVLVEGFEHRAAMTMAGYNHPYYGGLIDGLGYTKRRDYLSAEIDADTFSMPEKISRIAEISLKRGHFEVLKFSSKRELAKLSHTIGEIHNKTLGSFNETHNLTPPEIEVLRKDLLSVADPALIKILAYDGKIAGFLLGFHDLSAALQRGGGRITPAGIIRLLKSSKQSKEVIINGIGILPEYQRLGGNALLYKELERTVKENVQDAGHCDLVQIAETTWLMMKDLENLGARIYKRHRLYEKEL